MGKLLGRFSGRLLAELFPKLFGRFSGKLFPKLHGRLSGRLLARLFPKLLAGFIGGFSTTLLPKFLGRFLPGFLAGFLGRLFGKLFPKLSGKLIAKVFPERFGKLLPRPFANAFVAFRSRLDSATPCNILACQWVLILPRSSLTLSTASPATARHALSEVEGSSCPLTTRKSNSVRSFSIHSSNPSAGTSPTRPA